MKRLFKILGIGGIIVISICAFTIPSDPYKIIPTMSIMSFDKPLWLCIIVGYGFIYEMVLLGIYDRFVERL